MLHLACCMVSLNLVYEFLLSLFKHIGYYGVVCYEIMKLANRDNHAITSFT